MMLWNQATPFPSFEELTLPKDIRYLNAHVLGEDEYHFLLGAAIIKHGGVLRASFSQSLKTENDDHTRLTEKVSFDDGASWTTNLIAKTENGFGRSHGVYFSYGNELYVFCPCARYDLIDRYPDLKMEIYRLDKDGKYQPLGIALDADFWPMCEPLTLDDGSLIMAGLKSDNGTAAVALCDGTDITSWKMVEFPNPHGYRYWGETTVLKRKDKLIALIRNSGRIRNILISESTDGGNTWSALTESNFPASYSKLYAGTLTNGFSYLVFNMRDRGEASEVCRDTLAIAVGKEDFSRVYLIRDGFDAPPSYWRYNEWCYPYAYEDAENGILYVAYAKNKENCEVAAIPVESLIASDLG